MRDNFGHQVAVIRCFILKQVVESTEQIVPLISLDLFRVNLYLYWLSINLLQIFSLFIVQENLAYISEALVCRLCVIYHPFLNDSLDFFLIWRWIDTTDIRYILDSLQIDTHCRQVLLVYVQ